MRAAGWRVRDAPGSPPRYQYINTSITRTHGSILSNLRLDGIIAEIDGKPTEEFFQENREYLSDSNEHPGMQLRLEVRANESSLRLCECRACYSLSKIWCGRRDLNPHGPFKPCGFSCRLRLSPPGHGPPLGGLASGLRSGLSLHPPPEGPGIRCCPSSLYTFPAGVSPGLARDCHLRFPRLWAALHRRFPSRALKFSLSPLRMQ